MVINFPEAPDSAHEDSGPNGQVAHSTHQSQVATAPSRRVLSANSLLDTVMQSLGTSFKGYNDQTQSMEEELKRQAAEIEVLRKTIASLQRENR